MAQRIVITGAGGMVGRVLADQARREGRELLALTSAECDITDADAPRRFVEPGDLVINCAAYTKVDAAETDQARAHAVNALGAGHIAAACTQAGAGLVHISTDYVFGAEPGGERGTPYEVDDPTGPVNVYGRTKLAGEQAVLAAKPDAYVVRTSWVYQGGDGADFVATMRRLAAGDGPVEVVTDQIGSPTYTGDLVSALLQIADGGVAPGVLHAVNAGPASRFELAQATFVELGADPQRVHPVGSDRHPRPAPRPRYTALSARRSADAGLTPLRDWREALVAAVREAPSFGPLTSTP
ncbi:dTDP-4-dehydrorhamnose reductase [Mycobacterium frederiksbergense]|uniref:dTDP-4-dehydrorhamnose reductase n=1 Tax=Mycolicibacterium frederiksbergense TaxID=117567 RepID=A0ABT6L1E9_9MYCO|nr:dTDP-4-dehydrorhamnose reductase [Mycolicibacterium frederiksbergense]MDH6196779.1 dTDP-4-dehydrorhamnose reductase [Mycolicibacterium frederiksbergense]